MKENVAKYIASLAKDGDLIGVGTGSTVDIAIQLLAERIRSEQLTLAIVPSSYQTAYQCERLGIPTLGMLSGKPLSWGFDGADAVDQNKNAIKGKGAALLEEKILAHKCARYYLIVDESKVAKDICQKCAVPVEVIPSALSIVLKDLSSLGATQCEVRNAVQTKHGPVITEHGNLIIDATFKGFREGLEGEIKKIVGVVENGIFEGFANEVVIGKADGSVEFLR